MESKEIIKSLNNNIEKLSNNIERLKLGDYIELINRPGKVFYSNFMWGLSRGLGMAFGFTILGTLIIYILKQVVSLNLPIIGGFIANLVKIVQNNL